MSTRPPIGLRLLARDLDVWDRYVHFAVRQHANRAVGVAGKLEAEIPIRLRGEIDGPNPELVRVRLGRITGKRANDHAHTLHGGARRRADDSPVEARVAGRWRRARLTRGRERRPGEDAAPTATTATARAATVAGVGALPVEARC